jgi:periplasmic divalent cation tolerance protein
LARGEAALQRGSREQFRDMIQLFYCTFPNDGNTEAFLKSLVEQRLVACFNLLPMQSGYLWEGAYCAENECVAILKTVPALAYELEETIKKCHPYQTPCIMQWTAQANIEYANWVAEMVKKSPD